MGRAGPGKGVTGWAGPKNIVILPSLIKSHLQQNSSIPLLLPSDQRTMHRGLLNEKSLGPFRPVRPAGLDFQVLPDPAQPGPRAARPVAISNMNKNLYATTV